MLRSRGTSAHLALRAHPLPLRQYPGLLSVPDAVILRTAHHYFETFLFGKTFSPHQNISYTNSQYFPLETMLQFSGGSR